MGNTKTPADNPQSQNVQALREPLPAQQVEAFGRWIDAALNQLEQQHRSWIRPQAAAAGRQSQRARS